MLMQNFDQRKFNEAPSVLFFRLTWVNFISLFEVFCSRLVWVNAYTLYTHRM